MLKMFKTFGGYTEIAQVEKGCWINISSPSQNEIVRLTDEFNIPPDIVQDILDADERPRVEFDDDWQLVILRVPVTSPDNGVPYFTVPLGVFMAADFTVTLCSLPNEVLPFEQPSLYREYRQQVSDVLNFILKLFLRSASTYMRYLKQINQQTNMIEQDLEKSIRNKELNKLLKMTHFNCQFVRDERSQLP